MVRFSLTRFIEDNEDSRWHHSKIGQVLFFRALTEIAIATPLDGWAFISRGVNSHLIGLRDLIVTRYKNNDAIDDIWLEVLGNKDDAEIELGVWSYNSTETKLVITNEEYLKNESFGEF